jgi:hypothetical protein
MEMVWEMRAIPAPPPSNLKAVARMGLIMTVTDSLIALTQTAHLALHAKQTKIVMMGYSATAQKRVYKGVAFLEPIHAKIMCSAQLTPAMKILTPARTPLIIRNVMIKTLAHLMSVTPLLVAQIPPSLNVQPVHLSQALK